MRIFALFCGIVIFASCFAGCNDWTDSGASVAPPLPEVPPQSVSTPSDTEQSSVPEPENAPAALAELKTPGEVTVYSLYGESGIFEPHVVPIDNDAPTLLDIAVAVEKQLGVKIPIKSITQMKGMVVVDIAESFLSDYSKAETYNILTAYGVTLRENHLSFGWIQYQVDGEVWAFGEEYELPPLRLIEGTAGEFAAIRAEVEYEGLQSNFWIEQPIVDTDDIGWELTRYLSMLGSFSRDFSSTAELENNDVLIAAINATKFYTPDQNYPDNYAEALLPLVAPVSEATGLYEDWFWLKEHIEQSVKLLYGDERTVKHGDVFHYRYIETVGVYTPPHMGGGSLAIPVILDYEDQGDSYKIELAYITASMGGYTDPDISWEIRSPISEDDLEDYVTTKSRRREVIVNKTEDGRFVISSHRYKN